MATPQPNFKARQVLVWLLAIALLVLMLRKLAVQMERLDGDLSVYYHAANQLASGDSPYTGQQYTYYIYPPLFAWMMAPLGQATPVGFACAWGFLLGSCWLASILLIRRLVDPLPWYVEALTAALLFRPIWNGWGHGQPTLLICVCLLATLVLDRQGRTLAAAFWLALAGSLKIFPLFLGVLYLSPMRPRAVAYVVGWTALLTLLPALTTGPAQFVSLVREGFLGNALHSIELQQTWAVNHGVVPHILQVAGAAGRVNSRLAGACWLLAVTIGLILLRPRDDSEESKNVWSALALTSVVVVCPHVFLHYLTLLMFPATIALVFASRHRDRLSGMIVGGAVIVSLVGINASSRLFVDEATSQAFDAAGAQTVGLMALWLGLIVAALELRTEGKLSSWSTRLRGGFALPSLGFPVA